MACVAVDGEARPTVWEPLDRGMTPRGVDMESVAGPLPLRLARSRGGGGEETMEVRDVVVGDGGTDEGGFEGVELIGNGIPKP